MSLQRKNRRNENLDVASKKNRSNENLVVALTKDVSNENFNNPRYKQIVQIVG